MCHYHENAGGAEMSDIKTLGIMLDCSRNAVMKSEKVKEFAKLISDMGYNMLMLYTEDTYEVNDEPFFGHLRGRYSKQELRDIDKYCQSIGVELIPCIQTLAHLSQLKQWERYVYMFDCNDILMAGQEEVYDLIDKMFQTLSECVTTRRIHVGMDEAHFLGRGQYQDKHGYRDRIEILTEHLARVKEIADKYGFQMMIWSDMFIRLHNNGEYYGKEIQIPKKTIDMVPEGVELVYWDYYFKEKEHYDSMFQTHLEFDNPIHFAGGLWTWTGYVPHMSRTWERLVPAMQSVLEHSIDTVFFTMWGDGGKDCSFYTQLPMIYAASRMAQGEFDRGIISQEFQKRYGYEFDEFMNLELPNLIEGEPDFEDNPNKYLLFNDPFIGKFDFRVRDGLKEYYQTVSETLGKSINGRPYDYIFDMEKKLSEVLMYKADFGVRMRTAYQSDDRTTLREIAECDIPILQHRMEAFADSFREMWMTENKAFGLEVQEMRFGALIYRLKTCQQRLLEYLNNEIAVIEELEVKALNPCKEFMSHNDWSSTVTASVN